MLRHEATEARWTRISSASRIARVGINIQLSLCENAPSTHHDNKLVLVSEITDKGVIHGRNLDPFVIYF